MGNFEVANGAIEGRNRLRSEIISIALMIEVLKVLPVI